MSRKLTADYIHRDISYFNTSPEKFILGYNEGISQRTAVARFHIVKYTKK